MNKLGTGTVAPPEEQEISAGSGTGTNLVRRIASLCDAPTGPSLLLLSVRIFR